MNFKLKTTRTSMSMRKKKLFYPPTIRSWAKADHRGWKQRGLGRVLHDGFRGVDCALWSDIRKKMCKTSLNWYVMTHGTGKNDKVFWMIYWVSDGGGG
jgi:hypothetical protein